MAIHQGSLSLCRYRLLGGPRRRQALSRLNALLDPYRAAPLKLAGVHKEELVGWVRPVGLDTVQLPPDAPWDLSHCQVDSGLVLRLRIERRKVPAPLLQLVYQQHYFEALAKSAKAPGPRERRELREKTRADLMARALPAIAHIDALWRDERGELALFSTGKAARLAFENLFQLTFAAPLELTMVRLDPPLLGLTADDWADSSVASAALGRLSLATPVTLAEQLYP